MGLECLVVLGHVLRRTVVLPPRQPLYLTNNYHARRDFGFADFLNVTLLGSHRGWRTLSMDQFLATKVKGAPINAKADQYGRPCPRRRTRPYLPWDRASHLLCARRDAPQSWEPKYKPPGQKVVRLDELYGARHLHSPGTGSHRLLKNFYSFLYFQDKEQNKFYSALSETTCGIKMKYSAPPIDVTKIRSMNSTFCAIHARRNDLQYRL